LVLREKKEISSKKPRGETITAGRKGG